jgi:hypothetical protein
VVLHVGEGTGIHQSRVNGGTVGGQEEEDDDARTLVRVVVHAMMWLGCTDH